MSEPVSSRTFGHIPGVPVFTTWPSRVACAKAKVHASTQAGICGNAREGAYSIVISGGYEDDDDNGDIIMYTGAGGRNDYGVQTEDQTFEYSYNRALQISSETKRPVRVIRGQDKSNRYTPAKGYRYDGLYIVDEAKTERGKSGYMVCKFRLRRFIEDETIKIPFRRMTTSMLRDVAKAARRAR